MTVQKIDSLKTCQTYGQNNIPIKSIETLQAAKMSMQRTFSNLKQRSGDCNFLMKRWKSTKFLHLIKLKPKLCEIIFINMKLCKIWLISTEKRTHQKSRMKRNNFLNSIRSVDMRSTVKAVVQNHVSSNQTKYDNFIIFILSLYTLNFLKNDSFRYFYNASENS